MRGEGRRFKHGILNIMNASPMQPDLPSEELTSNWNRFANKIRRL